MDLKKVATASLALFGCALLLVGVLAFVIPVIMVIGFMVLPDSRDASHWTAERIGEEWGVVLPPEAEIEWAQMTGAMDHTLGIRLRLPHTVGIDWASTQTDWNATPWSETDSIRGYGDMKCGVGYRSAQAWSFPRDHLQGLFVLADPSEDTASGLADACMLLPKT